MNVRRKSARGLSPRAFTLVELLIVLAIIAVLAALLLPALARGKAAAKSAACKSNLRQLGMALNMYVNDYDKYPGNGTLLFPGLNLGQTGVFFSGNWMNYVRPYIGEKLDPNSRYNVSPDVLTVFHCPSRNAHPPGPVGGLPGATIPDSDYGYNEFGTGWRDLNLRLGLGFTMDFRAFDDSAMPTGPRTYITPGDIRNPSDLIAIGDSYEISLSPNYSPSPVEKFHDGSLIPPHNQFANIGFCDGHAEQAKGEKWIEDTDSARKRWNNDNQPHPETW